MNAPKTLFALVVLATPLHPQNVTIWDSKRIHWQREESDGSKYAVLEGDRSRPGPFTYAFFLPHGLWVKPHFHTGAARVVVVSGTLLLGDGGDFDKASARAIEAGGVFLVAENAEHFEGAKGDTLIIGVGMGPWKTTHVAERQ